MVARYDATTHAIEILGNVDAAPFEAGMARLHAAATEATGTYLVLLAAVDLVDAAYEHAESLVWRDAGALLATLQLVATAMNLGFCQLGLLGHDIATSIQTTSTLRAVGTAVFGELG